MAAIRYKFLEEDFNKNLCIGAQVDCRYGERGVILVPAENLQPYHQTVCNAEPSHQTEGSAEPSHQTVCNAEPSHQTVCNAEPSHQTEGSAEPSHQTEGSAEHTATAHCEHVARCSIPDNGGCQRSLQRQRCEPLKIVDVDDLEDYLLNQGCVIQNVESQRPPLLLASDSHRHVRDATAQFEAECADASQTCGVETLDETPNLHASNVCNGTQVGSGEGCNVSVTVNKGAISDQNVGVAGDVSMVQLRQFPNESKNRPDKTKTPTVVYIGTIEQISTDANKVFKQFEVTGTEQEDETSSITLSFHHMTPDIQHKRHQVTGIRKKNETLFRDERPPLAIPSLLLHWRVRPPNCSSEECDELRLSTPSSAMFSSAYTVTESDVNSSSAHSTLSSRRTSSERADDYSTAQERVSLNFSEYVDIFRQMATISNKLKSESSSLGSDSSVDSLDSSTSFQRLDAQKRKKRVFSYISCKDQREKEEEELWIANEAAYLQSSKSNASSSISSPTVRRHDTFFANKSAHMRTANKSTCTQHLCDGVTASTQTAHSSRFPSLNYALPPQHMFISVTPPVQFSVNSSCSWVGDSRESGGAVELPSLVPPELCSEVDASDPAWLMATAYIRSSDRRHFTARQRWVDDDEMNRTSCRSDQDTELQEECVARGDTEILCTAASKSTEQCAHTHGAPGSANNNGLVSESDRAILDKLAELNLTSGPVHEGSILRPTGTGSGVPFGPVCQKCLLPIYPPERRVQTSRDLVYHVSCFKCYQCGLSLNINSLTRHPLHPRMPGKQPDCPGSGAPDSQLPCCSPATTDSFVIKGDTRGLRYF